MIVTARERPASDRPSDLPSDQDDPLHDVLEAFYAADIVDDPLGDDEPPESPASDADFPAP